MTPQLRALKTDADALEIPWEIQKGLLFMIAFDVSFVPTPEKADEFTRQRLSLSSHLPDLPEGVGQNFAPAVIEELLCEIVETMDPDYRPRLIQTPSGLSIPSFSPSESQRLPPFEPEHLTLAVSCEVAKSLHLQIGEAIDEDVEGAYLAGIWYVNASGGVDMESTWRMGCATSSVQAPHMQWLRYSLYWTPEDLRAGNLMQKVLSCLLRGTGPFNDLVVLFADRLHYSGPGEKREEVWRADLATFRVLAIESALRFARLPFDDGDLVAIRRFLMEEGWDVPPREPTLETALHALDEDVRSIWGYDLSAPEDGLYFGERLDRRACIMFSALRHAILEPDWFALPASR